jgi:hypothetical protein
MVRAPELFRTFSLRSGDEARRPAMKNEDVMQQLLDSKSIDFDALGSLVAKIGPQLALERGGHYMFHVNIRNIQACFLPAIELTREIEQAEIVNLGAAVFGE